jgi:hypothetical protein
MTAGVDLSTSDLIQSNAPALFDSYQFYSTGSASNGWSGGITSNGGVSTNKMYKIKIAKGGELRLKGIPADLNTWSFSLLAGWNWLPYVANKNIPIGDALANLNPVDGDLLNPDPKIGNGWNHKGQAGCVLSHRKVISLAKERGYKNILVIEDDNVFGKNFNELFDTTGML